MLRFTMTMIVFALSSMATQASPLWGDLPPGKFDVGFRVERIDAKRSLEIMLWYPGRTGAEEKPAVTFGDYAQLVYQLKAEESAAAVREWLSVSVTGDPEGLSDVQAETILSSSMQALPNFEMADGDFPVIIWTMRYETMVAQSVLSEYLASHGYVVAFVRYQDQPIAAPWAIDGAEAKRQALSQSVEDLNDAIAFLSEEPGIDATNVAVMNWSYAAEASPRLQMQNDNVKLVVGLSSNPLSSAGIFLGGEAGSALVVGELDVPYLILSERVGSNGQERVPPEILSDLSVPSHYITFEDLAHGNFNVLEGMIPGVFGIEKVQPWSKGGSLAKAGYESICRHVLAYVNLYLGATQSDEILKALDKESEVRFTSYRFGPTH